MRKQAVKTVLQSVVLNKYTDSLPVMKARQRSAFPPNYIHSIDSSHMMLTALACAREGGCGACRRSGRWDMIVHVVPHESMCRLQP
jgi:DNA-directed RNA polymerase